MAHYLVRFASEQLDDCRNKENVFIFMHHPLHAKDPKAALDTASARAIENLLVNHSNVAFVLAAHEHLYYNPQRTNGGPPLSVVTGGAGAPLEKMASITI